MRGGNLTKIILLSFVSMITSWESCLFMWVIYLNYKNWQYLQIGYSFSPFPRWLLKFHQIWLLSRELKHTIYFIKKKTWLSFHCYCFKGHPDYHRHLEYHFCMLYTSKTSHWYEKSYQFHLPYLVNFLDLPYLVIAPLVLFFNCYFNV